MSDLEHKKSVLEFGCEVLDKRKTEIVAEGKDAERRRDSILRENESLVNKNSDLRKDAKGLKDTIVFMNDTVGDLMKEGNRIIDEKNRAAGNTPDDLRLIDKYFPEVRDMLPAIRESEDVELSEGAIKVLLDKKGHQANQLSLYYPVQKENIDAARENLHIKRDPTDNKFHLHVGGSSRFNRQLPWGCRRVRRERKRELSF